jgi:hypothetical protein
VFNAGRAIMVKSDKAGEVVVKRFGLGDEEDRQIECSDRLDDVIRAAVELGASYADLYAFGQEARGTSNNAALSAKLAVEAVAKPHREYERETDFGDDFIEEPEEDTKSFVSRLIYNPWAKDED